jgi:sugar lactone lactonase YvrE
VLLLAFAQGAFAGEGSRLVEALAAAVANGDAAAIDALQGPGFVDHAPAEGVLPGRPRLSAPYFSLRGAFPDLAIRDPRVFERQDGLVLSYRITGTQAQPYAGIMNGPRAIRIPGFEAWRLEDGKVVERRLVWDRLLLFRQLTDPVPDPGRFTPAAVTRLAAFAPPIFLESVLVHPRHGLLVTDLLARTVIRVGEDGSKTPFFRLPAGDGPGAGSAMCLAADGDTIYMTVISPDPAVHGVWRLDAAGRGGHFAALPPGTMPNGIARIAPGELLVADSAGGRLWRIGRDGQASVWLDHPLLRPRPYLGRFPGPNGVQARGDFVYVAVSDRGHILRIPVAADGSAGAPEVLFEDVPADDFAVGDDGSFYFTTHPFDGVLKIGAGGERRTIVGPEQGITGPTAAALGRGADGRRALYVVADGGLYRHPDHDAIPVQEQQPGVFRVQIE